MDKYSYKCGHDDRNVTITVITLTIVVHIIVRFSVLLQPLFIILLMNVVFASIMNTAIVIM